MKSILKKAAGIALTVMMAFGMFSCSNGSSDDSSPAAEQIPEELVSGEGVGRFYIAETELTYSKWYEVYQWAVNNGYVFQDLGREGSAGTDGAAPTANSKQPVTMVSWRDAVVWCNAASEKEGLTPVYEYEGSVLKEAEGGPNPGNSEVRYGTNPANTTNVVAGEGKAEKATVKAGANGYRLPTEAEWEYAAKGGEAYNYSGSNNANDVAWYSSNSGNTTHDVGTKTANGYGLYDMSGNVWEWCQDVRDETYKSRAYRGGSFNGWDTHCKISQLGSVVPQCPKEYYGFRVCRTAN